MILIVNPNNKLNTELSAIEPPLWAGLVASYHNADILDAEAEDLSLQETEDRIREGGYTEILIVVMGNNPSVSSTPKMPVAEALAERVKDLKVNFTGLHPIAVNYNKYPLLINPFQGFPMMPWHKLPMESYRAHNWQCLDGSSRSNYASIYTSLGCPFDCYYCPIHALYNGERKVQFRPIMDIAKEVETLVKRFEIRNLKIWDELFTLNETRVIAISELLADYKLNVWAYARLDTISEKMLKAMKKGGINWLAYGFESITDRKFIASTEDIIKQTRDAGINIIANFIFGLPDVTKEDDQRSLKFAKQHLFEFVNFYEALPYPGSRWYNEVKPDKDWAFYDQYGKSRNGFRDKAFIEYFTNPEYLTMIDKKFGEQAVTQINKMLEWKIR